MDKGLRGIFLFSELELEKVREFIAYLEKTNQKELLKKFKSLDREGCYREVIWKTTEPIKTKKRQKDIKEIYGEEVAKMIEMTFIRVEKMDLTPIFVYKVKYYKKSELF